MNTPDATTGLVRHPPARPYPIGPSDVASVLDAGLRNHPDRLALVDGERSWTWADLDAAVTSVAGGIEVGQPMLWRLPNCAELVIGSLATFRAGGVWLGSAGGLDSATVDRLEAVLGPLTTIRTVEDVPHGNRPRPDIAPDALAAVTFTSGTSGTPKAVAHSQRNLLLPGLVSLATEPPGSDERLGTPLRLTILNLLLLGPMSALLRGSTFVVMDRTFAVGLAEDIERLRITRLFAVPTLVFDLATAPEVRPAQLESLDRVILGGSGADPRTLWDFFDRFEVRPTLSYGLSEAPTGVVRESLDDPIGSGRGFPLPHVKVAIVDGEIRLSPAADGPWAGTWTPTLGYLGEPERTAALFDDDGRLRTGDLGAIDDDGAVRVTGRMSDLIIRGGKNIDPIRLEQSIRSLDRVLEVLVVGVPDDRLGEMVGVAVVVAGDEKPVGDALVELLEDIEEASDGKVDHLAVLKELPRNAMGKVVRSAAGIFDANTWVDG